ncbi:rubredoxin [Bordetella bronchiseptica]|uniref:rubredoxin n=1 Tax=Bordetella bronchiseptica TaxID=518 RepID=UPI000290359F|nr:rubredoxin [Bordetella bronchiseptica]KAK73210.1 rubredoxin [Bordetella bronchiseptica MO211]CCN17886.1 rubredoxin [Bordetella bronchiseptica MO211]
MLAHLNSPAPDASGLSTWLCVLCGWVYDEAAGHPESGIAPGTPWADVPAAWLCPDCGVGKSEFQMIEI